MKSQTLLLTGLVLVSLVAMSCSPRLPYRPRYFPLPSCGNCSEYEPGRAGVCRSLQAGIDRVVSGHRGDRDVTRAQPADVPTGR